MINPFQTPEMRYLGRKKVLIHFNNNNRSLEGYVIKETKNSYFLSKSQILDEKASFDLQGTIIVPKSDVFFVQVLAESL
jgi:hypothetical protein